MRYFFRKGKTERLDNDTVKVSQDDIQTVFQRIRGTSQYWRVARNELIAKVKQLGPFQYFFTVSCAEMRWSEVFATILKSQGHTISIETKFDPNGNNFRVLVGDVPLELFLESQPIERITVLQQFVVHVTRIFNNRVQTFIQKIVMSKYEGCLPVLFYSYHVEMQLRGMVHIHGCLWLDEAFLRDCSFLSEQQLITNLIDNFITCALPPEADPLRQVVQEVQTHHHTKSCTKKSSSCRFGFPKFPSEVTLIAQQPDSEDEKSIEQGRQVLQKAKSLLHGPNPPLTFEDFYEQLNVSREVYHSALSISSRGKIVILKRNLNELYINNYNSKWLTAWNGNMDLQFCCDPYAVVTYICDYYSKDETGLTDVLKQTVKQLDERQSPYDMLKILKSVYLTHRQIGACEATYRLLKSLHLKDSNITTVFLTTGFPENRYRFLKWTEEQDPQNEAVQIEGREGSYLWTMTIHEKYSKRPSALIDMCLAEFVINYKTMPSDKVPNENELSQSKHGLPLFVVLNDNAGVMRLREIPCVLRLHESKKKTENHEFVYSECLLYFPWKNEDELHRYSSEDSIKLYHDNREVIVKNKCKIFPFSQENELIEECLTSVDTTAHRPNHIGDTLDPQGEQMNEDELDELLNPEFSNRHPGSFSANETSVSRSTLPTIKILQPTEIRQCIRSLHEEQRKVFDVIAHFVHQFLRGGNPTPPLFIVQGEAGTGKTKLINTVMNYVSSILAGGGSQLDKPKALVVAPTGMAASLVNGSTLHSTFQLNFGDELTNLADSSLDKLRSTLEDLVILIVDEISMVRSDLFYQLHERLQSVKQNDRVFGGVSVLLFGDLLQLKPVRGRFIFQQPRAQRYAEYYDFSNLWMQFQSVVLQANHRLGINISLVYKCVLPFLLPILCFRQKGDCKWIETLQRVRTASLTEDDHTLLSSLQVPDNKLSLAPDATRIFYTNAEVDSYNNEKLNSLPGQMFVSKSVITSPVGCRPKITRGKIDDTAFNDLV